MCWVQSKCLDFVEFWRTPRSDSGGPAGDGNRILHQVFYPHFLKKMKMSLPTSAAKSLFHVFYLGYPHKLYTIHPRVPCEILQFSCQNLMNMSGKCTPLWGPPMVSKIFPDMFNEHVWEK